MFIPVQIYNFYLRKDKTVEENVSIVGNKQLNNHFPQKNEQTTYLETAIQKNINK